MARKEGVFVRYIREGFKRSGLTQRELARKLGVGQTYISKLLSGNKMPVSEKLIVELCRALKLDKKKCLRLFYLEKFPSLATIFPRKAEEPPELVVLTPEEVKERFSALERLDHYAPVPLVRDEIAAGSPSLITDEDIESFALIYSSWLPKGQVACIRVRGKSMEPTLTEGSIVAVHLEDRKPAHNKLFALYDEKVGGCQVKRLQTADEEHLLIVSDNPDKDSYPTLIMKREGDPRYRIIGRIAWAWERFD